MQSLFVQTVRLFWVGFVRKTIENGSLFVQGVCTCLYKCLYSCFYPPRQAAQPRSGSVTPPGGGLGHLLAAAMLGFVLFWSHHLSRQAKVQTKVGAPRSVPKMASLCAGDLARATIQAARLFLPSGVNGSIWMNSALDSPGSRMIV